MKQKAAQKILFMLLTVLVIVGIGQPTPFFSGIFGGGGYAVAAVFEDFEYEVTNGTEVTITRYTGNAADVEIPAKIEDLPVTTLGDYAFWNRTSLTHVTVPSSVVSIERFVFSGCTSLESVVILDGAISIGTAAFDNCSLLKNLVLPDSLASIGYAAFDGCGIESIDIPVGVSAIDSTAFRNSYELASFNVASENAYYLSIDGVLYGKDPFTLVCYPKAREGSFVVPDGVEVIGEFAFYSHDKLMSIVMPNTVKTIGDKAFNWCENLTSVVMQEGVISIGDDAFMGCPLESITLPDSIESIARCAFYDCINLKSVTLPANLESIEYYVFGYSGIESIYISASVSYIDGLKFDGCDSLMNIYVDSNNAHYSSVDGVLYSKDGLTLVAFPTGREGSFTIPDGVEVIENRAFIGANSLTQVIIPDNITKIEDYAFAWCDNLAVARFQHMSAPEAIIDPIWDYYEPFTGLSDDFTIVYPYYSSGYTSPQWKDYPATKAELEVTDFEYTYDDNFNVTITAYTGSASEVVIPKTIDDMRVTAIDGAFQLYEALEKVTIPYGVTSIGEDTFAYCGLLASITLPGSVTSIGPYAFNGCVSLESIDIPDSVTFIGRCAFYECTSLKSITLPESLTSIEYYAFGESGLESIYISKNVSIIDQYKFDWCFDLASIDVAEDNPYFTSVDGVLYSKDMLTLVSYPSAREGEFSIPYGVETICMDAFGTDSKLTRVVIPASVTMIEDWAFDNCTALVEAVFQHMDASDLSFGQYEAPFNYETSEFYITYPNNSNGFSTPTWMGYPAYPAEPEDIDFEYTIDENSHVTITAYIGSASEVVIPVTIEGMPVTTIGESAFSDNNSITSVIIQNGVSSIEDKAFESCGSLESITLPDSLTNIGLRAFSHSGLTSIVIPGSVAEISEKAFYYCESLTDVVIQDGVSIIGEDAFSDCILLENVTIPDSVTEIIRCAFYDCYILKSIDLPANLEGFTYCVFGFSGLESITIPASVSYFDEFKFDEYNSLMNIYVDSANENYQSIDGVLYSKDGSRLVIYPGGREGSFTIPDGVEVIEAYAFSSVSQLPQVIIPASVTFIEDCAFAWCGNLSEARFLHMSVSDTIFEQKEGYYDPFHTVSYAFRILYPIDAQGFDTPEWFGYLAYPVGEHAHDYTAVVTEPTCTEQGYTTYTCSCGDSYVDDYVEPLDHDWDDGVVTTPPTEDAEGVMTYTCRRCGDTYTEPIPKLTHEHDYTAVVTEPTCTEQGYTTYTCACGDSYVDDYVEPLGHDWDDGVVTTPPTEDAEGVMTYTCRRCGDTYTEPIPKLTHEHDYTAVVTPPTCTEQGYTTYTCSCGDSYVDDYVEALGHDWDDGVVTTPPTEDTEGVMTYTCRRCGDTYTEPIPKLGNPKLVVNGVELDVEIIDGVVQLAPTQEQMEAILNTPGNTVVIDLRGSGSTDVNLLVASAWFNNSDKTIEIITDAGSASVKTKTLWNNSGKMREITVRGNSIQFSNK